MASITDIPWPDRKRGKGCPFCGDRPDESEAWSKVSKLSVSSLYLQKAQTYRGYCVIVFDPRHATRLTELSPEEWKALSHDISVAQRAIERVTQPDHVNVASLGNIVPHLHWHIIPRYQNDSRWGAAIWTTREDEMEIVRLSDAEHRELVEAIRAECI
jgi:diadenosine tetraphosphate (Ap4A) HIT family hydrolase